MSLYFCETYSTLPQLSGEVHTPVGPQTFMGLVGHHHHPCTKETSMRVFSFWRCAGSAGV